MNRFFTLLFAAATLCLPGLSRAQAYPPTWSASATYAAGDLVQYGGNWYRSVKALAAHGPYPASGFGSWELNYVRSNTTLVIGMDQPFTSFQDAWAFALEARIADGAYLHLDISSAHGTLYDTFGGPFSLDHAFGAKISIIGDNSADIFLGGSSGFAGNGFTIDSGHNLSLISNVSVLGSGAKNTGVGISANGNASLHCTGVAIYSFMTGAQATQGASFGFDANSVIGSSTKYAVYASQNANMTFPAGASFANNEGSAEIYASTGANVVAAGTILSGSPQVGADAENGGSIDITGCMLDNFHTAVLARNHSYVNATNVSLGNDSLDFQVAGNGVINATGVTGATTSIDTGTGSYIY